MNPKNDNNGAIIVLAGFAMLAYVLFIVVYALAVTTAFVFTILSLCAWRRQISVFGMDIEPREAHVFVWSGLSLAGMTPLILTLVSVAFNATVSDRYFFHFLAGGYTIGAFVGIWLLDMQRQAEARASQTMVRPEQRVIETPREPAETPFTFASWDDEETRR